MKKTALLLYSFALGFTAYPQNNARVKEYSQTFTTYPFSDPGPIPDASLKIYPYFRYDGFTATPVQKEWKVVALENDFIKLIILPEIGGKIWAATEKKTGHDFLYNNHVIKFRDVAMRGPWTSGGIEANYGIIGHTPNCATPVDYTTRTNEDGSASCFIGTTDLLTQTTWRIEINLPKDKAYFTTNSVWDNNSALEQPYYTWMNTGLKAGGNLEFVYPGNHYLGHEGEYSDWPMDKQRGKNLSFYEQNNFGGYKSYHVFGVYTDFFGAYWHNDDYGMARYSTHDDKPGKKIWIWGLSQQGMIWEKLLTDTDGQYVEVQSGRLFNQSAEKSMLTPFKYRDFKPGQTDKWTEYWFPVMHTKGFVKANEWGALNVRREQGWLKVAFCPVQKTDTTVTIYAGQRRLNRHITALPLQTWTDSFALKENETSWRVAIGDRIAFSSEKYDNDALSRPLHSPEKFDWNSLYGLYLAGESYSMERMYPQAEEKIKACLQKDSNYLPALNLLSQLEYRKMNYQAAFNVAGKALSINTYDAAANYHYALAALKCGKPVDAKDGFDIASQSAAYRVPAFVQLSHIYFREDNLPRAADYAEKALAYNASNTDALQLLSLVYRKSNNPSAYAETIHRIEMTDPLGHFVAFEKYFRQPSADQKQQFLASLRSEMLSESCMDLAVYYYNLGCTDELKSLLAISPAGWEANAWKQCYSIPQAPGNAANPPSAFPFREETAALLMQQPGTGAHWRFKYAIALIYAGRNNRQKAEEWFAACKNEPDDAAFYAARSLFTGKNPEADLQKALAINSGEWRYTKLLAEFYLSHGQNKNALDLAGSFYRAHAENYIMGMLYAKALLANHRYAVCDSLLSLLQIIPFEGATEGRVMYREAKLQQALGFMKNGRYEKAQSFIAAAQLWPENLGSGKPYDADIDTRMEDWMNYICLVKTKQPAAASACLQRILAFWPKTDNTVANFFMTGHLVTAWALEKTKGRQEGLDWLNKQAKLYPGNAVLQWCINAFKNRGTLPAKSVTEANLSLLQELMLL